MPLILRSLLVLFTGLGIAGAAAAQESWYKDGHGRSPTAHSVYYCHGYTCRIVTPVRFSAADIAKIAGALAKRPSDAAAEREALSKSVQEFERIVGARIGTSGDLAAMQFAKPADDQLDCIDEATNTTSLLLLLAENGYIHHHRVGAPAARGFFIDLRYPHATAVLTDKGSGEKWAIDSWPRANAEPPVVQPLVEWKRSRTHIPDT
jgi:hypothetical protein